MWSVLENLLYYSVFKILCVEISQWISFVLLWLAIKLQMHAIFVNVTDLK